MRTRLYWSRLLLCHMFFSNLFKFVDILFSPLFRDWNSFTHFFFLFFLSSHLSIHSKDRGTCIQVSGYDTCLCQAGYGGFDCSAKTPLLPAIAPAFGPSEPSQYTSNDKYGNNNPLFNEATIATIWLEVSQSDLEWMMNAVNAQAKQYLPANFTFFNGNTTIATTLVGLRIKGGASRGFIKKSWKISFDQYDDNQSFYQQKKLLLKATSMTPDFVRERTSRDLIYSMGAATQRMVYTNVFINGVYRGLFVQMDDFDQTFLKSRFGNSKGGLWKCGLKSAMPTLLWQGPDCANYSSVQYRPENTFAETNCSVLVHFIDVLNNAPDDEFETAIQQVFDVPYYLRTLTVEILTSNWDGGSWDGNNYYLYYDPSTTPPLFKYMRQDLDMSIGCVSDISLIWPDFDLALRVGDIFKYGTQTYGKVLTTRILSTPSFQQLLTSYMSQLMNSYYQLFDEQSPYFQRVKLMHASVAPFIQMDYWHRLDMGMNYEVFNTNIQQADINRPVMLPNTTSYSMSYCYEMLPYAQDRYSSALKQIQQFVAPST